MISDLDLKRIEQLLRHFGCNPREVQIYLHCLQSHPSSVQDIAKKLKEKRTTVHSAIEQLLTKGFLYETRKGKQRLIGAESPDILKTLLQKKKNEIQIIEESVDYTSALLAQLKISSESRPTVRFYEEIEGIQKMLEETLEAKAEVLVFSQVQYLAELLGPAKLQHYYLRRSQRNISTRLVLPPSEFIDSIKEKLPDYKMQVRNVSADYIWKSGIFAWNSCVAILSYSHGTVSCTILEDEDISHFFREVIFEMAWRGAKPL